MTDTRVPLAVLCRALRLRALFAFSATILLTLTLLSFVISISHGQQAAETVYQQNFEASPLGQVSADARDDSGRGGRKVLLSLVQTGNPKLDKALNARVNDLGQLWLGDFTLREDEPYRVSLDMASKSPQIVTVSVRQSTAPYTEHGTQEFQTSDSPRTLAFVFHAKTNSNPAHLQVVVRGSTQLTIDNLCVEHLTSMPPANAGGDPLSQLLPGRPITPGNLLPNSSFELEKDGWFRRGAAQFLTASDAPHGKHAAKLMADGNLSSSGLALSLRNDYLLSAQVKAISDRATVRLAFEDHVNAREEQAGKGADFEVRRADGWKRITFRYHPLIFPGGITPTRDFYVGIGCRGGKDAEVLVDAVEVRAVGGDPQGGALAREDAPYAPAAPVEMAVFTESPFGVATVGETIVVRVLTAENSLEGRTNLAIQDERGRVARQLPVRFSDGMTEARITLPNLPPGYWRLVTVPFAGDGRQRIEGEAFVSVVPHMPTVPPENWHFGTHVRSRNDIQAACYKLGWRFNRLHDVSTATQWTAIQPQNDKEWVWHDDEIAALHQEGVGLLGGLDQLPQWVPKDSNHRTVSGTERATEVTLPLWQEYCRRTAEHFRGSIDTWEVTNEPNLSGMTPEHYVHLLQSASEGIRAGNPDAKIVGLGGVTPPMSEWTTRALALGAGKYCDVISFHSDGGTTWGSESGPDVLIEAVSFVKKSLTEAGTPALPVWDTKSELSTQSAFRKFRQPYGSTSPLEGAKMMPKAVASVLASGLGRWYFYAAFDANTPGEIAGFTAGDINDTIKMPFQPMAVAISLLEGRTYKGLDAKAKAAGRVEMTFQGAGESTRIVWMQADRNPQSLPVAKDVRVLNHWGRILPTPSGTVTIGQEPIYLVTTLAQR